MATVWVWFEGSESEIVKASVTKLQSSRLEPKWLRKEIINYLDKRHSCFLQKLVEFCNARSSKKPHFAWYLKQYTP